MRKWPCSGRLYFATRPAESDEDAIFDEEKVRAWNDLRCICCRFLYICTVGQIAALQRRANFKSWPYLLFVLQLNLCSCGARERRTPRCCCWMLYVGSTRCKIIEGYLKNIHPDLADLGAERQNHHNLALMGWRSGRDSPGISHVRWLLDEASIHIWCANKERILFMSTSHPIIVNEMFHRPHGWNIDWQIRGE